VRWPFSEAKGEARAEEGRITIPRLKITTKPTALSVARAK
jgi:hypothetical protein